MQCFNCWKQCWERSLWDNKIQWEILNACEYVYIREKIIISMLGKLDLYNPTLKPWWLEKEDLFQAKDQLFPKSPRVKILFQKHLFKPTNGINYFRCQLLHTININNRWWLLFSLLQGHFNSWDSCAPIIPPTIKQLSNQASIMQTHCFH